MKKTFALLLCMAILMLMPFAHAESVDTSQIKLTLLERYNYSSDEDLLYIAYAGPKSSGWNMVNSAGDRASFGGSQYNVVSWPAQEDQWHTIFHITLPSGSDDLSLLLHFENEDLLFPLSEMGEPVSPENRGEYGIYNFGTFFGYVEEAFIYTDEPTAELRIEMKILLFSDGPDNPFSRDKLYTNAAEQFRFYAKDGTPLNEALGCAEYEIEESYGSVTFRYDIQTGGSFFDDDKIKKNIAETFGYIEYTYDDGETICLDIQNTAYYRGNGKYERVPTQAE